MRMTSMYLTDPTQMTVALKEFILSAFLPGEDPSALTEQTPLISTGILDSIATLRLVAFLEEQFGVRLEAHEVNVDHLDTVAAITQLVLAKQAGGV
jgi:acyl carrier protein